MEVSKWNKIMDTFQKLLGWDKGITEVIVTKRLSNIGRKSIIDLNDREEKYLVHILRKRYKECLDEIKRKDST
tara:strand:+ start:313 stop:531 length:219 start_codon:yes stop_codon:yes gene_type:complete